MNIFLTLRKKIYLLSLISGLFFIGIILSGYSNLTHLSDYFEGFKKTSTFAENNIHLAKNVERLRNSVQKFTYTGLEDETLEVHKLYTAILISIHNNEIPTDLPVSKNFTLIKTHLEKYISTFEKLKKQMASQKQIRINKNRLITQIEGQIELYFQNKASPSKTLLHLRILSSLQKAETSALYFFDTLENRYVKNAKKALKSVRSDINTLIQKEKNSTKKRELNSLLDNVIAYSKITTKEVQHTRSHLFLVNVVMAAEAYEVLYQANQISATSQKILETIYEDVNTQVSYLINTLGATGILSLLIMIVISLIVTRSIVRPISKLTHAFLELSKGNNETPIPQYHIRDEIGSLTQAAESFRHKNKEIEELLEHSKELSADLALSEERFSLALEGAQDGLWDWNLVTDKVFYSDTWKELFCYKTDEITNTLQDWKDKIHPDDLNQVMQDLSDYLQGKSKVYESEMRIICKDGQYKHILARGKSISDDSYITRMIGLHMDITEQKMLEKSLVLAKDEADKANKSKSDFLANMSHEIRTPLNGVLGLTDLVLNTDLNEKQKDYLTKSKSSSQALLRVINDILDYSKIEAGKLDLETKIFDLNNMLENIKDLFDYQATKKGLALIFPANIPTKTKLLGDALRLTQILTNLIGNALKFTDKGSVELSILSLKEDDSYHELQFSIKDSGIGISKEVQEKLFKEFSQADTSITRQFGGTGLGLAISKQLVHMMKGKVWIESIEGEGSNFIFTVNFEKPKADCNEEETIVSDTLAPAHLDALKGVKILLVEDNKVNQIVLMGLLEDYSVLIDIANNGQEAVEMASKDQYDLILMDLQMPVMDGFEATRIIRTIQAYERTPIFALSAAVMQKDKELTQEAGMDEHLAKPIDKEILLETLVAYTQNR